MIRSPSSFRSLYAWHADAIAGLPVDRHDGLPECGWFRMRRVKGGPWVPVEITCRQVIDEDTGELAEPETLVAVFDNVRCDAAGVWTHVEPISRKDFNRLREFVSADQRMSATMVAMDLSATPTRPPRR